MIYFVTHYSIPTNETKTNRITGKVTPVFKAREYRTLKLTPFHAHLRNTYGGRTVRCDTSVEWPFGVYGEIVAEATK